MFDTLGFEDREGIIYPKPVSDLTMHDTYVLPSRRFGVKSYPTPSRYMLRLYNMRKFSSKELSSVVVTQDESRLVPMAIKPYQPTPWKFDGDVAERFQREAEIHIPDYDRVLKMSVELVDKVFDNKDVRVLDVGSALGNTLEVFYIKGYTNVYGVESSEAMIAKSLYKHRVMHSDQIPDGPWDVVLANWTLHFIHERREHIQQIYNNMSDNGLVILTDKMNSSVEVDALYQQSKLDNGATPEEVDRKKQSLLGVLVTKPLTWYLNTLHEVGFREIQIINNKYMFTTIYARK
jgi:tRNA (cmo5U34)-methyltransferase